MTRRSSILKRFFTAAMPSKTSASPAQCQPRAVDPPEQIELDLPLVGHRDVARPEGLLAENELRFGGVVLPPVHPDVEPRRFRRVVPLRQGDGVRLHRAVDRRIVGVDLLFTGVPGRRSVAQLFGPCDAQIEHHQRVIDGVLGAEQLRIFQQNSGRPWRTLRRRPPGRSRRAWPSVPSRRLRSARSWRGFAPVLRPSAGWGARRARRAPPAAPPLRGLLRHRQSPRP